MNKLTLPELRGLVRRPTLLIGWVLLIGIFLWWYTPVITSLVRAWCLPDYQHGFFVPIFALVLLLVRGKMIAGESTDEDWWLSQLWSGKDWGAALLHSQTLWMGAIAGAAAATAWCVFAGFAGEEGTTVWWALVVAGCYGAILGGLVVLVAGLFRHAPRQPDRRADWTWWAMAFFALWILMRLMSALLGMERTDEWSILPFAAGVTIFMGGWRALRWAWPSIIYLYFITPLPGAVQNRLGPFLQVIGTRASVYAIQTLGIPALRRGPDGTVIQLPEKQLGVVEACSGLRMLMLFFAICVGAAFLLRCPLWKKIIIVISAVPIAVFSNVTRITVTAVLYDLSRRFPAYVSEEAADWLFHKGAGLLMMPLAMLLLLAIWKLLEKLVGDHAPEGPLALSGSLARNSAPAAPDSGTKQ